MARDLKSYAGAMVELADKETSFFDPETRFGVTREQKAKVGDTVGRKTGTAIMSGRLLVVGGGRQLGAGSVDDGQSDAQDKPKAGKSK